MFCIICNQKLTVGKVMHIGEYGLMEVDIQVHCVFCKVLSRKKDELEHKINCDTIEMKGHLREYRQLKKSRDILIEQLLDLEDKINSKYINGLD
jgi:cell division protein FtsB